MMSQVYDVTKLVLTQKYYSCYGHPLHHICNIAGFAGTKLRLKLGIFLKGGGGTHSLQ